MEGIDFFMIFACIVLGGCVYFIKKFIIKN